VAFQHQGSQEIVGEQHTPLVPCTSGRLQGGTFLIEPHTNTRQVCATGVGITLPDAQAAILFTGSDREAFPTCKDIGDFISSAGN
jgi:hypothetical protein